MKTRLVLLLVAGPCLSLYAQPGALDPAFNPDPQWAGVSSPFVRALAVSPAGKIYAGGQSSINWAFLASLNPDGRLDVDFFASVGPITSVIYGIAFQPDDKVLAGGDFTRINSIVREGVARFHADGALDMEFNPSPVAGSGFAFQLDGKVIVGGGGFARLLANGSRDTNYAASLPAPQFIYAVVLQPNGKCLVGHVGGIHRLNATGSLDTSFNPGIGVNSYVRSIVVQPDGKIVIGGGFTSINSVPRPFLARLNANGTLDNSFAPLLNNAAHDLALYANGKIVVSGHFTTVNGFSRRGIALLHPDGSLDTTFDPGSGASTLPIMAMAVQSDGKILVGGFFTNFNGVPRPNIARLLVGPTNGPPGIAAPPADRTAVAGTKATFSVGAFGAKPLRYQWQHRGTNIPGETNHLLTISATLPQHDGEYRAIVTNPAGTITSGAGNLNIVPASILVQPESKTIRAGSNVIFTVEAFSSEPLAYQWTFNGVDLPGQTFSSLAISNVQVSEDGDYAVHVSNSFGDLSSDPARLTVLVRPVTTQPPLSQTAVEGGSVTLSVSVSGHPAPFWYLWRRGSARIDESFTNEKNAFVTIADVQTNQSGLYSVSVTNAAGAIFASCNLTVLADTDRDGMPDVFESERGYNPTNSADGRLDSDGDGVSNSREYAAGTNPANALSYLKVERISLGGGATIEFLAVSNRTYTVEYADELENSGAWAKLVDVVAQPETRTETIIDSGSGPRRYYRLATPRLP